MSRLERIEELALEVYELARVRRDMWRRAGFGPGQTFAVLGVVARKGPIRVGAVADDLQVDISVASRQLAALEQLGHVERSSDPEDGRSRPVAVTPGGREALDEAHQRMLAVLEATVDDWRVRELDALTDGLARLRADYSRAVDEQRVPHAGEQPAGGEPITAGGAR